jgi:hypothetical protein
MKSKSFASLFMLMFVLLMSSVASAAPTLVSGGLGSLGEIERITLNNPTSTDPYEAGVMVVGGVEMIIPRNLLIDLPANRLSLQQIFAQAPAACKAQNPPESGLAKADRCNGTGSGGIATLTATRTNAGNVIVGDLFIQKAAELVVGVVSYINYDQGYYRVNGSATDPANTGAMVRLNDPISRHTIQSGAGCFAGSLNCSPDPRFNLDPDNYTNTFATGYPVCIPSTVSRPFPGLAGVPAGTAVAAANGTGDLLCPDTNRTAALTEPPVADSRRFAPVKVGDSVTAEGNYESVGGVRFLSAHTSTVQKALATSDAPGQPDYLFLEEVDIEAPAFQNQRQIAMFIGFTTRAPTDVDIWSLHRDPVSNQTREFPLASVQGCDNAQGGPGNCSAQGIANGPANTNIFKIIYRDDYLKGYDPKLSPCAHLLGSRFATSHPGICNGVGSFANDFAVLSPIPHEIIARTGLKITSPAGSLITIDINGNPATNGEYLFPLGLNLGGIGVAEMSEIDLNLTNTPTIFDGIPWNLDRRLGPSGCLNNNGACEAGPVGSAAFALDPFPFSGLDPRTQASGLPTGPYSNPTFSLGTLASVRDRIFSYVDSVSGKFNGTVLPCGTGIFPANCPADPPLISIIPTPLLNMYPPIVVGDSATTTTGVPVAIDVLANDVPVFGSIDLASVLIATGPASGTVAINATTGAITYTPTNPLVSNVSFTYTVANNFGSRSLPGTVTVTIVAPATGVTLITDKISPQIVNTSVTFIASGAGGSGTYEYRFWDCGNNGTCTVVQDYSTNQTWILTTPIAGIHQIVVHTRSAGSSANLEAQTNTTYLIIPVPPAAASVTLFTDKASPQIINTPVTFVASAAGGSGTYEYRFWDCGNNGTCTVVQDFSSNQTWALTTSVAGIHQIVVHAKSAGSTAEFEAQTNTTYLIITTQPAATAVTLVTDKVSPQIVNTPVTFTASASGGSGTYEYRFWDCGNNGTCTVAQDYSTNQNWILNTSVTGIHQIVVHARSVGSTAELETQNNNTYSIIAGPPAAASVTLFTDKASPQTANTPVTFAASASGGSGTYEYRFWDCGNNGTCTVVQNYSTSQIWTLSTSVADLHQIVVHARNAGSTAELETQTNLSFLFQ